MEIKELLEARIGLLVVIPRNPPLINEVTDKLGREEGIVSLGIIVLYLEASVRR
jgi:hypothetical protein